MSLTVEVTSPPDREDLVAEIWQGDEMMAEVDGEPGTLTVELYPRRAGAAWVVGCRELEAALRAARSRLSDMGVA